MASDPDKYKMRRYIDLMEKQDTRDMIQKLRDLIDHPNTEPFLRDVAQRKLDKILAQQAEEEARNTPTPNLPALNIQINYGTFQDNLKPLPREEWDDVYLKGNGKTLRFRTVIERLLPLRPFRIDIIQRRYDVVGPHVNVWFQPEDEPTGAEDIERALNAGGTIWADAGKGDASQYLRGGQSRYFVSFIRYVRPKKW